MALNYQRDLTELNRGIYQLEDDLDNFDKYKTEDKRRDINFDINVIRFSLTCIKTKINNFYLGSI